VEQLVRIAVVNLTGGGLSGGYVKYLRNVMPRLASDRRVSHLHVCFPDGMQAPDLGALPLLRWRTGVGGLAHLIASLMPDVVFVPTARWPGRLGMPVVTMVRNMEPLLVPYAGHSWTERLRNLLRRRSARQACSQATRIIAVSTFVAQFLEQQWQVPPAKIGVVYHGVEEDRPETEQCPPALVGDTRPFLFTAGSIRPARGLEDVLEALGGSSARSDAVRLVIAGGADRATARYARRLHLRYATLASEGRVLWLGSLTPEQMAWCYRRCLAFVTTTRAEACPNTALEALAHGCVIISTNQPPMPEFFHEHAHYYPPGDSTVLADVIRGALGLSQDARVQTALASRRRASAFTWAETARKTVDELQLARERAHVEVA
jgi:glycosyltransferase involved in cell wall biosynthesis